MVTRHAEALWNDPDVPPSDLLTHFRDNVGFLSGFQAWLGLEAHRAMRMARLRHAIGTVEVDGDDSNICPTHLKVVIYLMAYAELLMSLHHELESDCDRLSINNDLPSEVIMASSDYRFSIGVSVTRSALKFSQVYIDAVSDASFVCTTSRLMGPLRQSLIPWNALDHPEANNTGIVITAPAIVSRSVANREVGGSITAPTLIVTCRGMSKSRNFSCARGLDGEGVSLERSVLE